MQTGLKDEGDSHCCIWLNVAGWAGQILVSRSVFARGCGSFRALIFVQPRKQNPRYLCMLVSLLDTREHRMVHAYSVSSKSLLKNRSYNDMSDEVYFCPGGSLSF